MSLLAGFEIEPAGRAEPGANPVFAGAQSKTRLLGEAFPGSASGAAQPARPSFLLNWQSQLASLDADASAHTATGRGATGFDASSSAASPSPDQFQPDSAGIQNTASLPATIAALQLKPATGSDQIENLSQAPVAALPGTLAPRAQTLLSQRPAVSGSASPNIQESSTSSEPSPPIQPALPRSQANEKPKKARRLSAPLRKLVFSPPPPAPRCPPPRPSRLPLRGRPQYEPADPSGEPSNQSIAASLAAHPAASPLTRDALHAASPGAPSPARRSAASASTPDQPTVSGQADGLSAAIPDLPSAAITPQMQSSLGANAPNPPIDQSSLSSPAPSGPVQSNAENPHQAVIQSQTKIQSRAGSPPQSRISGSAESLTPAAESNGRKEPADREASTILDTAPAGTLSPSYTPQAKPAQSTPIHAVPSQTLSANAAPALPSEPESVTPTARNASPISSAPTDSATNSTPESSSGLISAAVPIGSPAVPASNPLSGQITSSGKDRSTPPTSPPAPSYQPQAGPPIANSLPGNLAPSSPASGATPEPGANATSTSSSQSAQPGRRPAASASIFSPPPAAASSYAAPPLAIDLRALDAGSQAQFASPNLSDPSSGLGVPSRCFKCAPGAQPA